MKLPKGLKTSVFTLILAMAFGYSVLLVGNVSRHMDALGEAHGGDGIWSLSQLEVEYRKLYTSLSLADDPATFAKARNRFDIFYSRVVVVREGDIARLHKDDADFRRNLDQISQFLIHSAPYFDNDDQTLQQALPELQNRTTAIEPHIRDLALAGVTTATLESGRLRDLGRLVLMQLIGTTLFLILGMAILIFILRRLYQKAQQGEKAKGNLLAVMSHEIRTPLNGILGAADLLQSTKLSDVQQRYVTAMKTSGEVLMGHVNDVLEMSRLTAENHRRAVRPMTLPQVVSDLINSQSTAAKNGNTLEVRVLSGVPDRVLGDQQGLQQALLNLVGNALKFTRNGNVLLEVDTIGNGDLIEFRVSDTGPGISETEIPHVFDDFFAADVTHARPQQGVGLGLGITKRIVEAMGGEIGVESILGEGSLFWVRLPMPRVPKVSRSAEPNQEEKAPDLPQVRAKILLVEDNPINRMITCDMLRNAGHIVTQAIDGAEGLEKATAHAYDLILMDISMPGMDGFDTARAIRATNGPSAATPIVALTAQTLSPEAQDIKEAGMQGVFHKPMSAAALHSAVVAMVSESNSTLQTPDTPNDPLLHETIIGDVIRNVGIHAAWSHYDELCQEIDPFLAQLETETPPNQTDLDLAHKMAGAAAILGLCRLYYALVAYEGSAADLSTPDRLDMAQNLLAIWRSSDAVMTQFLEETENPLTLQ